MEIIALKKNQIQEVEITSWSSEGLGVCRVNGCAVFVPGTIPGERWLVRIVKLEKSYAYGKGEKLLSPSASRTAPDCPIYGKCGGCALRHVTYEEELKFKLDRVNQAYRRIGKLELTAETIIGAEKPEHYRNKTIYAVSEDYCYGFYRKRTHDIIPVDQCRLHPEQTDAVAGAICNWMRSNNVNAFNESNRSGHIRHIFIRSSRIENKLQVTVVTAKPLSEKAASLVCELTARFPQITGIIENINPCTGNTVLAGYFNILWGEGELEDILCNYKFRLSPQSFFQINPSQAERLYEQALRYAAPTSEDTVLDLYCGTGTISLCLASKVGYVIGVEVVPEAIENAKRNAAANGITNAEFICADAGQAAKTLASRGITPKAIVVDPPRKGLSADVIEAISVMSPERVVYVSCNVSTQARDLALFEEKGYKASKAVAVDMFPRTEHVETVVLMSRNKE